MQGFRLKMKLRKDMWPIPGFYLPVGQFGDDPSVPARDADGVLPLPGVPVGASGTEPPMKEGAGDGVVDLGQALPHAPEGSTVDEIERVVRNLEAAERWRAAGCPPGEVR